MSLSDANAQVKKCDPEAITLRQEINMIKLSDECKHC